MHFPASATKKYRKHSPSLHNSFASRIHLLAVMNKAGSCEEISDHVIIMHIYKEGHITLGKASFILAFSNLWVLVCIQELHFYWWNHSSSSKNPKLVETSTLSDVVEVVFSGYFIREMNRCTFTSLIEASALPSCVKKVPCSDSSSLQDGRLWLKMHSTLAP